MRAVQILGLAAALACGAAASQAAVAPASASPLRLCADPANLPFSSSTADPAAPGLYVEIGSAVAQALGRPLHTVWSLSIFGKRNLRTTLLAGQCDLAVGLPAEAGFMGPRLIFTQPILQLGYALVLPPDSPARSIDDLKGLRVAVQFGSPPQGLLAARSDITSVTAMDPEEAMRRLAAGEADAAFLWGASAGYINRVLLNERYRLVPVQGPQLQFQAAIGLSNKQPGLRDEVDAVLPALAPRIRELSAKYAVTAGAPVVLAAAGSQQLALAEALASPAAAATADARRVDPGKGKEIFNSTCAHCHGPSGVVEDRKINLRRLQLKYGEQLEETYFTTVNGGRPSKGMPAWKEVFTHQDLSDILGYLRTIQEK
ncbi:c-type cytochrome [Rivibacter subsaxonicus]|uniref:ABC-type amino acid transport substrate-binding protein n=1 Tax=Rivibacter subsaxonicus TaxID=457575 RepID=A0A4Q7VP48_9BURK|nr:transporter substrate-binding domain-containing protein [Rivibacter subsaxonicus]RZT98186.1 ABC-type amino acid transport substrate-binding protein [Rivibacter subsaxonicus]